MGLVASAMLSAGAAAVFAFIAVFASSKGGPEFGAIDNLGTALVLGLTAPDHTAWQQEFGTYRSRAAYVRSVLKSADRTLPPLPSDANKRQQGEDHLTRRHNRDSLKRVEEALGGLDRGVVRGLQVNLGGSPGPLAAGTPPPASGLSLVGTVGDVNIYSARVQDPVSRAVFAARVYRRPYKARNGRVIGSATAVLATAGLESKGAGAWLFLAPLFVGLAGAGWILGASRAAAGLRGLGRDLEAVGRGRLEQRVIINAGGEVGYAQRAAERMVRNLQLIQTTGSEDLDEAVEKELSLASQIHQSLRPQDPPRIAGYDVETLFKPGRDIGGDYFDYIELDDGRVAMVVADCSENLRGVPAAMIMAMTRAYLKSSIDPATGPAAWLQAVNRRLARDLKTGMAVTALVAVVQTTDGQVVAASAGHRPMILWRQGKTATVNPNGIALGLDVGPVFDKTIEEKTFSLHKNDRLVLHTDGVISAQNEGGDPFGDARLVEAVRRHGGMNSAAFVNLVAGAVDAFLGASEQTDDITISTLKRLK
jgi:serine phosphatase RsbU (regulator of sigma subunit)